ncbi:MAG: hypothetical protein KVP17_002952 [Porospora cf. gigantea B]|uniref:uncharacterized protein n=1 Tax=Porospora cf. gigantea B TaxID=2853592 RepID=UPI003571AE37|nr:MAG: hypothetical protein KVP17_002952 [Porospora cf. gigantea B]
MSSLQHARRLESNTSAEVMASFAIVLLAALVAGGLAILVAKYCHRRTPASHPSPVQDTPSDSDMSYVVDLSTESVVLDASPMVVQIAEDPSDTVTAPIPLEDPLEPDTLIYDPAMPNPTLLREHLQPSR